MLHDVADHAERLDVQRLPEPERKRHRPDGEYEERAAYLAGYEALPKTGVRVESIDIRDAKFRVRGDTAIVTGRAVAKIAMQDNHVTEDVRFTRVYRRAREG
jgi:ketosteroid isomerase-like protein